MPLEHERSSDEEEEEDEIPDSCIVPESEGQSWVGSPSAKSRKAAFVEGLSTRQMCVHTVLDGLPVKCFMSLVILANAIQVVYESDLGSACRFEKQQSACDLQDGSLKLLNWLYLLIYSIELGFRVFVNRSKSLTDPWDIFDFTIIFVGIFSETFGGLLPSTGILRLARLARLARAFHLVKLPHELRIMVHGFFSALKAISMGAGIVFLMLTLWGIVAVELLNAINHDESLVAWYAEQGCERCPKAWGSVADSVFSFVILMVMGEEWDSLAIPIIERAPWTICLFMGVFFTVVVGMTNLILAVIVEKALSQHDDDLRRQAKEKAQEKDRAVDTFTQLCEALDTDGDGTLSLQELRDGFNNSTKFRDVLHVMDVGAHELDVLFHIMDKDQSGDVSYEEFAQELANVKNSSMRTMAAFTKHHVIETKEMVGKVLQILVPPTLARQGSQARFNYAQAKVENQFSSEVSSPKQPSRSMSFPSFGARSEQEGIAVTPRRPDPLQQAELNALERLQAVADEARGSELKESVSTVKTSSDDFESIRSNSCLPTLCVSASTPRGETARSGGSPEMDPPPSAGATASSAVAESSSANGSQLEGAVDTIRDRGHQRKAGDGRAASPGNTSVDRNPLRSFRL